MDDGSSLGPLPESGANDDLEDLAFRALRSLLPISKFYIREEAGRDKGVDRCVELKSNGRSTNLRSQIQIKARQSIQPNEDGSYSVPVETSNLNYLLYGSCPVYILYLNASQQLFIAYAGDEEARLRRDNPNWHSQQTVSFRFAIVLNDETIRNWAERTTAEGLAAREQRRQLQIVEPSYTPSFPDAPEEWQDLAREVSLLCSRGDYKRADRLLNTASKLNKNQDPYEIQSLRAFILRRSGDMQGAADLFGRLYHETGNPRFELGRIITLQVENKEAEAAEAFEQLPEQAKQVPSYFAVEASLLIDQGEPELALKTLSEHRARRARRRLGSDFWGIRASAYSAMDRHWRSFRALARANSVEVKAGSPATASQAFQLYRLACERGDIRLLAEALELAHSASDSYRVSELGRPQDDLEFRLFLFTAEACILDALGREPEALTKFEEAPPEFRADSMFVYNRALMRFKNSGEQIPLEAIMDAARDNSVEAVWINLWGRLFVPLLNENVVSPEIDGFISQFRTRFPNSLALAFIDASELILMNNITQALQSFREVAADHRQSIVVRMNAVIFSFILSCRLEDPRFTNEVVQLADANALWSIDLACLTLQGIFRRVITFFGESRSVALLQIARRIPSILALERSRNAAWDPRAFETIGFYLAKSGQIGASNSDVVKVFESIEKELGGARRVALHVGFGNGTHSQDDQPGLWIARRRTTE